MCLGSRKPDYLDQQQPVSTIPWFCKLHTPPVDMPCKIQPNKVITIAEKK